MGLSSFKSCYTNSECVAPNPNPKNYSVLRKESFTNATLLRVKYSGCTNFEGEKLLVFMGDFTPQGDLDPHFEDDDKSPVARFKPNDLGYELAKVFCEQL